MFDYMVRYGTEAAQKGNFDGRWGYHPMMGLAGTNPGFFWFYGILWLVTWVLVIVALVALIRWLWKKGDKVK